MRSLFCLALLVTARLAHADPAGEVAAFSAFPQVDLAALTKESKTVRGPALGGARDLGVQSCFVVAGAPEKALAVLRGSDPTSRSDSRVYLHGDLAGSPTPGSFAKLRSAPDNDAVGALAAKTQKGGNDLQISREEAKKLPGGEKNGAFAGPVADFWAEVLAGRAQSFANGGAARQPAYDFASDGAKPGDSLARLTRQDKVRRQFAAFLGESGITGGRPSLKAELYWELLNVEDEGVLTLGSFASRPAAGGGFQAADVLYYASGGYDVALTLYQAWPVDVGGQPATLVWRGDYISSASLGSLRGVEKLGSESVMIKDVVKSIGAFKRDAGAGR